MSPSQPLEIAAPTAALDPLAPWIGARTSSERALAATFWTSFGGLSGLFHATAIFFSLIATLLPIPFLTDACSQVKPVSFRPPERVEVSIVEVEPPPVLEEIPPPPPVEVEPPAAKGSKARKTAAELETMNVGMLALLGSVDSSSGAFASLDSAGESAVFGALIGDEIGDAFGAGGLGLSGVGVAGGVVGGVEVGGAVGLGGLGTIGHGTVDIGGGSGGGGSGSGYGSGAGFSGVGIKEAAELSIDVIETDLDRSDARRALLRKKTALATCESELPADLTLRVKDGVVVAAEGAPPCVAAKVSGLVLPGTGYVAVHLALR